MSDLHQRHLSRRGFLATVAAGGAMVAIPASAAAPASLAARQDFVIRGALVMTMEPGVGDLPNADILVRDGTIAEIGKQLLAPAIYEIDGGDMIVLPGFIDAHTHLWTTQMRGQYGDTSETSYFVTRDRLAQGYTADDMYQGTRLGAAEAIHAGITTVVDFCHNIRSTDFAHQCVRALLETGLRTRYLYGPSTTMTLAQSIDLRALEMTARSWTATVGDAPLSLGLGWRAAMGGSESALASPAGVRAKDEFEAARSLGLPISVHVIVPDQFNYVAAGGFFGADVQLVHMTSMTPAQLKTAAQAGSPIAVTPVTEMRVGFGLPKPGQYLDSGARLGLGIDSNSLAGSADMFQVMRLFQELDAAEKKSEIALAARRTLELATIDGARSLGMDREIGSLARGKRADLIMIDTRAINLGMVPEDPAHLVVEAARPENVDTVVIDGRILKRHGTLTSLDRTKVVQEARQSFEGVLRRTRA